MPRNSSEAIALARAKNIGRKNTPETIRVMSEKRQKYWNEHPERKQDAFGNVDLAKRTTCNVARWRDERPKMLEIATMGSKMARFMDEEWDRVYYSIPDVREWMSVHSWARGEN